jgi:integrase
MLNIGEIKGAKAQSKPYKLADQGGMYLEVKPTGTKTFCYKYRIAGKEGKLTIGTYPEISLAEARELHLEAKKQVALGIKPQSKRVQIKQSSEQVSKDSFSVLATEWFTIKKQQVSARSANNIESHLRLHLIPFFNDMDISTIKPSDALKFIQSLDVQGKKTTARQSLGIGSQIFRHAIITLRAELDPFAPLAGYIKKAETEHARNLGDNELKLLLDSIANYSGRGFIREALILHTTLAFRSKNTIELKWKDVDFEKKMITLDKSEMKSKRTFETPIPDSLIPILKSLKKLTAQSEWVFPSPINYRNHISDRSLNAAIQYATKQKKYGVITSHDLRATFSTRAHEQGDFDFHIIESQLAHAYGDSTTRSYNHSTYIAQRTSLINWYSQFLSQVCPDFYRDRFIIDE